MKVFNSKRKRPWRPKGLYYRSGRYKPRPMRHWSDEGYRWANAFSCGCTQKFFPPYMDELSDYTIRKNRDKG